MLDKYLISESQKNITKFQLCFTAIVRKYKYIDNIENKCTIFTHIQYY
jgi:hypothetical protein